jgi:hypothetical protein
MNMRQKQKFNISIGTPPLPTDGHSHLRGYDSSAVIAGGNSHIHSKLMIPISLRVCTDNRGIHIPNSNVISNFSSRSNLGNHIP